MDARSVKDSQRPVVRGRRTSSLDHVPPVHLDGARRIMILGFGAEARSAVRYLLQNGTAENAVTIVTPDPEQLDATVAPDLDAMFGDATCPGVLRRAGAPHAWAIVVALGRDDLTALATATARSLAPQARIAASVHDPDNAHLLRCAGADCVLVTSAAVGRLLGMATRTTRRATPTVTTRQPGRFWR
jgi:voltage-gated potassium channel